MKEFLFCIFIFATLSVRSQQTNSTEKIFPDDLLFTEVNPLHEFGIFTLSCPFYIGDFSSKGSRFSAGYSFANTWHPRSSVYYPRQLTDKQRQEVNALYMTERMLYFYEQEIKTTHKTFSSDGVLQDLNFSYLVKMGHQGSFLFKLNSHLLSGGGSFVHYLASDRFIEWFHTRVNLEDNFGRKQFEFNRAQIDYEDEYGRKITIDQGQAFLGTLEAHYYRPIWNRQKTNSALLVQAGAHLTIPLNKYYPNVAGGLSTSMLIRKRIFSHVLVDLGTDFTVSHHSLLRLGNPIHLIDRNYRSMGKTYLALTIMTKMNNEYRFGLINSYQDSFLKGYIFSHSQDQYQDLGVSFLREGDIWLDQNVTKEVRLNKLTAASMYFFSIKSYLFFGIKKKNWEFTFTAGEDYLVVDNAPDIQYGFQFSRVLKFN